MRFATSLDKQSLEAMNDVLEDDMHSEAKNNIEKAAVAKATVAKSMAAVGKAKTTTRKKNVKFSTDDAKLTSAEAKQWMPQVAGCYMSKDQL